ncbi:MAG TPA: CAP domain-containing protein, partial [Anaerolineales bacterium]|nr:CAP domain-containing protein [Anaerolineales bacterium]
MSRTLFPSAAQQSQPTPSELINDVNALRLAYGLIPLTIHPILMQTAQGQADALLASDGAVGHSRPNGLTYTDQLLILGYPLSGDLSLGGYRAENFVFGAGLSPQDAVQIWRGDEPHTNTMLSPNYLNIGAGVAIASDGTVYYVIDCARPTSNGQPQEGAMLTVTVAANSPSDAVSQYMVPVSVSTARPDGDV